ncbi:ATP-dependent helicase [Longivirga aurantiaca]|uniref:DNA 3'-5' helicase n=1 Tax=Longivirga aurantiaca TaxID=1837743 RepID=A0ABW1SZ19_9ACTN
MTSTSADAVHASDIPKLVLDRTPPLSAAAPALDAEQRRVVAHREGPLLVLAGPGTGKTTTLVEAMVARLQGPTAVRADQVLGLTFGRRAAGEWRERVTARLGGGVVPTVTTFHSFAYALVRQAADPEAFAEPLRLLSGPEQEARLRELLTGAVSDGRLAWPADLAAALGTRGLASEVRAVVAKARALGLDPWDLEALAAHAGSVGPAWKAVGEFLGDYLDVLDAEGVTDYTEVVHRAGLLAHDPDVQARLRAQYSVVLVDEFQDTDPAQVRLLQGLVGPSTSFVVVGDPDQSIYAFRGADIGGILGFRETFRAPDGSDAPVIVLRRTRRFGPVLRAAAGRVLRTTSLAPLPATIVYDHRHPVSEAPAYGEGSLEVRTYDSEHAEAAHVADRLRREHLERGVPWSDMAVLVRSGRRSIPTLRRALLSAGVPVEVASDEVPLHDEPALAPLLTLLRVAVDLGQPQGPPDAGAVDDDTVHTLLLSPLGDADPADVRRLGGVLRRLAREEDPDQRPAPSGELLRRLLVDLVADPATVLPVQQSAAGRDARARHAQECVVRVARLLHAAREVMARRGSTEEVLWTVWSGSNGRGGSGWPRRLEQAALRGGDGGRRADSDLDAVLGLFAAAERAEDRFGGRRGVANFLAELDSQVIPADSLAERGIRGPAVRLLTAHRAKGLQWRLVVVPGVQEGVWPDLRRRGSLLQADRLERTGLGEAAPPAALLAEERRLFYVACTRAQESLVVSAVRSSHDDGPQPSRLLAELAGGEDSVAHVIGRPARPLSVSGLVAQLRATAVDSALPATLRAAATRRLAALASAADDDGRPLVPAAHPDRWWGLLDPTESSEPVREADAPVALSGSQLSTLGKCPLQWFLGHETHAEVARTTALGFGSVVHTLADAVARGELPPDLAVLETEVDRIWSALGFEATWQSEGERVEASEALRRFLDWHDGRDDRTFVASEHEFDLQLPVGEHGVRVRGSFDRVEVDADGAVHVADLKTQRNPETGDALAEHIQLGVYQLAVQRGALDSLPADVRERAGLPAPGESVHVAGAELVLLRVERKRTGMPAVQEQAPIGDGPSWVDEAVESAEQRVRAELFVARPGSHCSMCDFRRACPAVDEGREVLP